MLDYEYSSSTLFKAILTFIWTDYIWKAYLSLRQYKHIDSTLRVPRELTKIVEPETFEEAKKYSMEKQKFEIFSDIFETLLATFVIYTGVFAKIWDVSERIVGKSREETTSALWTVIVITASSIMYLPPNLYQVSVLEEKFNFNRQTLPFFINDELKTWLVGLLIFIPISIISTAIVLNTGTYHFLYLWVFLGVTYISLMSLYPKYIAPLFDDFDPLPQGDLRFEIENLASDAGFPLKEIYVVRESKRSTHSNAYYTGLFTRKNIVIYDNMLESPRTGGCEIDEILAVLSHELCHWKLGYLTQKSVLSQINLLCTCILFGVVYSSDIFCEMVGFKDFRPVAPCLLFTIQYLMPHNIVLSIFKNFFLKKLKDRVDMTFHAHHAKTDAMVRAMVKTHKENLEFPFYDSLYGAWYHSQASLLERIAALEVRMPT